MNEQLENHIWIETEHMTTDEVLALKDEVTKLIDYIADER